MINAFVMMTAMAVYYVAITSVTAGADENIALSKLFT